MSRVIFGVTGALVVVMAVTWLWSVYSFSSRAFTTTGVVTAARPSGSHPEVRFATEAGEVTASMNGLIVGYRQGEKVSVLFLEENPREARLDSFGALWGFPLLFLVLGLVFLGVARVSN